jgi:hypothetical protein
MLSCFRVVLWSLNVELIQTMAQQWTKDGSATDQKGRFAQPGFTARSLLHKRAVVQRTEPLPNFGALSVAKLYCESLMNGERFLQRSSPVSRCHRKQSRFVREKNTRDNGLRDSPNIQGAAILVDDGNPALDQLEEEIRSSFGTALFK